MTRGERVAGRVEDAWSKEGEPSSRWAVARLLLVAVGLAPSGRSACRDDLEALGAEVGVEREGAPDAVPAHDEEARPVDQGDVPSPRSQEGLARLDMKGFVDPRDLHEREQVVDEPAQGAEAETTLDKGSRLDHDVFVGQELDVGGSEPRERCQGRRVVTVVEVENGVERRRVNEDHEP